MKLERIYNVPLRDAYKVSRNKRTPRAIKLLRSFIVRHMKANGEKITISPMLNDHLWIRSIQKPPHHVKVRPVKEEGHIQAFLEEEKVKTQKKTSETKKEKKTEVKPATQKSVEVKKEVQHKPTEKKPEMIENKKEQKKEAPKAHSTEKKMEKK